MRRGAIAFIGAVACVGTATFFLGMQYGRPIAEAPQPSATTTPTLPQATTSAPTTTPPGLLEEEPESAPPPPILGLGWKSAVATVFWVGEGATEDNGYIQNSESAWDEQWAAHFGGMDDPDDRCLWRPCAFTPKENPFYVALPYNDLDDEGDKKADASAIPWNDSDTEKSILKNRWVEVRYEGVSCYGQWEDVGPYFEDDIRYVFGPATTPKNQNDAKAGIDLSPAIRDCLGVGDVSTVSWRFVDAADVPAGDWKRVITTRASQ